jgi:hypothetical protein
MSVIKVVIKNFHGDKVVSNPGGTKWGAKRPNRLVFTNGYNEMFSL